jgi:hypothetical protein
MSAISAAARAGRRPGAGCWPRSPARRRDRGWHGLWGARPSCRAAGAVHQPAGQPSALDQTAPCDREPLAVERRERRPRARNGSSTISIAESNSCWSSRSSRSSSGGQSRRPTSRRPGADQAAADPGIEHHGQGTALDPRRCQPCHRALPGKLADRDRRRQVLAVARRAPGASRAAFPRLRRQRRWR